MRLNVNTANNVGLGGSIDYISESGWMGMHTRVNATQFLQQRRGIETGETWTPVLNMFCSSELELEQMYKVQMHFYKVSKLMKAFS